MIFDALLIQGDLMTNYENALCFRLAFVRTNTVLSFSALIKYFSNVLHSRQLRFGEVTFSVHGTPILNEEDPVGQAGDVENRQAMMLTQVFRTFKQT